LAALVHELLRDRSVAAAACASRAQAALASCAPGELIYRRSCQYGRTVGAFC
jgi:hypothetical protein